MRTIHWLTMPFVVFCCLALLSACGDSEPPVPLDNLFSKLSYEEALAEAKKTDKVVFLDFTTSWCGVCRQLERDTLSRPKVQEALKERAIAIQVDGDKYRGLTRKYGVRGFPTLVFVDANGEEIDKIEGYCTPYELIKSANGLVR